MEINSDSRPRAQYQLPNNRVVVIIFDHGDAIPETTTYQQGDGSIVTATFLRMAQTVEGTYRLYAGKSDSIVVKLNAVGAVSYCDDMEQIAASPSSREPHRGDKASFFYPRLGTYFANASFFSTARKLS